MEWPRPLEKDAEELRKQQGLGAFGLRVMSPSPLYCPPTKKQEGLNTPDGEQTGSPGGEEDGAEEALPTILVDGEPQKVRYQPTLRYGLCMCVYGWMDAHT